MHWGVKKGSQQRGGTVCSHGDIYVGKVAAAFGGIQRVLHQFSDCGVQAFARLQEDSFVSLPVGANQQGVKGLVMP